MARWHDVIRTVALSAVALLGVSACGADGDNGVGQPRSDGSSEPLHLGTVLPLTGPLSSMGPPQIAGVDLAAQEINEAGGIFGTEVRVTHEDSGDTQHTDVAAQSVTKLVSDDVSVIIGAASSAVTLGIVDQVVSSEVVQVSPASTATELSGYSEFFFRTAPPDTVQGDVLADLILEDGHESVALLSAGQSPDLDLSDVIKESLEAADATITYGDGGEQLDPEAADFEAQIEIVIESEPQAVVLLTPGHATEIVAALLEAGMDAGSLYLTNAISADFAAEGEEGALKGAQQAVLGTRPSPEFEERLDQAYGSELETFAYGAESYDAAILTALAAIHAGATDGVAVQGSMAAVSGTNGGTECTGFAECADLLSDGEEIMYQAESGIGTLNENNDPSFAAVNIYRYGDDNTRSWVSATHTEVLTAY